MGFGEWLADRTGIHPHAIAHKVGGVLDNKWTKGSIAAALAASGIGAPLGAAIMGAEGLLGGALHEGGGLRDAVSGGAKGAAIGGLAGGARGTLSSLRNAFAPGSQVGASAGQGINEAGTSALGDAAKEVAINGAPGQAAGGGMMGALKGAGQFAVKNPNAVGMGLQGVGGLATAGSQNALTRAQAEQLAAQTHAMQLEEEEKRRRGQALEPLLRALMGNMQRPVAGNPYA